MNPASRAEEKEDDAHANLRKHPTNDYSTSGDELVTKVRKPYTITKQRERWTEEEHHKFLEALKMYGRAWRRIEEHVGTKTAVQIRSHAQKFFSKLEREQATRGFDGKVPDIDIPPPRPKRKPMHPYPRKAGAQTAESNTCSQAVLPSAAPLSRPPVADNRKPVGFAPYVPRNGDMQPELKLFGHTVVFQRAADEAAVSDITDQEKSRSELADENLTLGEFRRARQASNACASAISMLNDSSSAHCCSTQGTEFGRNGTLLQGGGDNQLPPLHASAYSMFLGGLQVPPFLPWQLPITMPWPGKVSVHDALKSMFPGLAQDEYRNADGSSETSAAFAAATIAAASAWWSTLQGSAPPGMIPREGVSIQRQEAASQGTSREDEEQEGDDGFDEVKIRQPSSSEGSPLSPLKRSASGDCDDSRRTRSRSVSGSNDPCENEDNQPESLVSGNDSSDGLINEDGPSVKEKEAAVEAVSKTKVHRSKQQHGGEQRKEVSQEGRMAFQALFSHNKLPQKFSSVQRRQAWDSENREKTPTSSSKISMSDSNCEKHRLNNIKQQQQDSVSSRLCSALSSASSRSGFVPYRRVETNSSRSVAKDGLMSAAQGSSSCGLQSHIVEGSWCSSMEEEVVKQS